MFVKTKALTFKASFFFFQADDNIITGLFPYLDERKYCTPTKQAKGKRKTESRERRNKSLPYLRQDLSLKAKGLQFGDQIFSYTQTMFWWE